MRRLFIVDKAQVASEMIRAGVFDRDTDDYISVMGIGYQQFKIPRNLPFSQAPFVIEPEYKSRPLFMTTHGKQFGTHVYSSLGVHPDGKLTDIIDMVRERIAEYGEIILCSYNDHRSIYFANDTLNLLLSGTENNIKITRIADLLSLDAEGLSRSIDNRTPFCPDEHLIKYAEAKYYFDWLWSINSATVFGKMFQELGVNGECILSKNELLVLHLASQGKLHQSPSQHYRQMESYAGTGKHLVSNSIGYSDRQSEIEVGYLPESAVKKQKLESGIGTFTSRMEILRQLELRGLIVSQSRLELTESGRQMLAYLHKDTFDPDLPFRLQLWAKTGNMTAIERYITTFFSKQKRFFMKKLSAGMVAPLNININHDKIIKADKEKERLDEISSKKLTAEAVAILNQK